jgi:predicted TIM-barrel fold metal-dependent hydrolase
MEAILMEPIIDVHAHLGDILFPGGGKLIGMKGIKKRGRMDVVALSEWFHHGFAQDDAYYGTWFHKKEIQGNIKRNASGTLENFLQSMEQVGISHSVALPVPPNLTFDDLLPAAADNSSLIPYTGVDFSREYDVHSALKQDVQAGAKGMKLHPILQCEKLTSERTFAAVEAFAPHNLPVLVHTGICYYYTSAADKTTREQPLNGNMKDVLSLVAAFPGVNFILGHAGLMQWHELKASVHSLKNVWVDGSFKNPKGIRELVDVLGVDKVLFGSDWPWGNRKPALKILNKACKGDKKLERAILFENACELMDLSM